ncbi:MAG: hypothetical protein ABSA92_03115 [Candidatus Bathyarchaeia archaeon]
MPLQVSISRVINAPLSFVYSWWTDFRENDPKITGQKRRLTILERNAHRVIMSVRYTSHGRVITAARIVTLKPPNAWHLDWIGDENEETGNYQLRSLGARKTRLHATFKVNYKYRRTTSKLVFMKNLNGMWDKYVAVLERDYQLHENESSIR